MSAVMVTNSFSYNSMDIPEDAENYLKHFHTMILHSIASLVSNGQIWKAYHKFHVVESTIGVNYKSHHQGLLSICCNFLHTH